MKFTEKDRDLLVTLYEMPHWAAFRRNFLENRQMELAQQAPFAADMDRIAEIRGKITELKDQESEMRKLHDKQRKKS